MIRTISLLYDSEWGRISLIIVITFESTSSKDSFNFNNWSSLNAPIRGTLFKLIFDISSNYDVYDKHRFNFEKQYYHISEAILNDGSGYVSITSNTVEGYRDDDYHLTKQQMDDFHAFLESCEIIHDENVK